LKDVENLIELAYLVEAINSRMLMKYSKKRETNTQKRAIRRITMGFKPFQKRKCRKLNWIKVIFKKQYVQQRKEVQGRRRKIRKSPNKEKQGIDMTEFGKTWKWVRKRKNTCLWILYLKSHLT
jgi:hypothetical protein